MLEETLHTVGVETEAVLNSRPLTSVSDDLNDYEALTPNHFLILTTLQVNLRSEKLTVAGDGEWRKR